MPFNLLPNDKILDWSKLRVFANDKINVNQKPNFALGRVENIAGKHENAGYQHFLLFPQCFQAFENIEGKGENAGLFLQCFLPFQKQISIFSVILYLFYPLQMISICTSLKLVNQLKSV